jgi:hypothetical protein
MRVIELEVPGRFRFLGDNEYKFRRSAVLAVCIDASTGSGRDLPQQPQRERKEDVH